MFHRAWTKFGILPDQLRKQELDLFIQVTSAEEDDSPPMVYPESVDFT